MQDRKRAKLSTELEFQIPGSSADFESELEPKKRRKGGVKVDAYLSDEEEFVASDSDEEIPEDIRNRRNEDDMFGDEDDEIPKPKQFLKSSDIEGQQWDKYDHEEGDFPIESFNMDQELEEGDFTESGVYIRKKDDQQFHDQWLRNITDKEIELARDAHKKFEQTLKVEKEVEPLDKLYAKLLGYLRPGENTLAALKRLGSATAKILKWKKPKAKAQPEYVKLINQTEEEIAEMKVALDSLTSIASQILEVDQNVYERTFEQIALDLDQKKLI